MANQDRVGRGNTSISTDDNGITSVQYHKTKVVMFDTDRIILNSGGWLTTTTKTRMNQTSNQFNLGFKVFQAKGNWFVTFQDVTVDFQDYTVLDR